MFPVLRSLTDTQGFKKSVLFILFCNMLLKICTAQVRFCISKLTFLWSAFDFMNIWERIIAVILICIEMHLDPFTPVSQANSQWYFTANRPVLQTFLSSLVLPCRAGILESKKHWSSTELPLLISFSSVVTLQNIYTRPFSHTDFVTDQK